MSNITGVILFFGLIIFLIIAFLAKYINPSLRLFRLTIYTYLGVVLVTALVSMTLLYPNVYGLEVKQEKSDKLPLYEFTNITEIPDDYLVETFDIVRPGKKIDIQIAEGATEWLSSPTFFVEKEAGRDVVTINHYASPYIYDGTAVANDKSTLQINGDIIEYVPEPPPKIKRSFNRMLHDQITKQFYGTKEIYEDWSEYFEAENYFHIITPENVEITNEQDMFYIDYLEEEE